MTLASKLCIFIQSFDLFGVRPSVYFKGKAKSSTSFGFCLSFLLIIFTSICFGYFGQDLYYRRSPTQRYHEQYNPTPESITLDPEIDPIILELNSPFGDIYYTDSRLLYATVSQLTISKSSNKTSVIFNEYPMEICTKDHFNKIETNAKNYFLNKELRNYFCIPKDLKNLTMQGAFDQDLFQTIKFTIYTCSNGTTKNDCFSPETIEETLGRGFVGLYFTDHTIDQTDYKNPKKIQPKEVFTNFVLNSQKEIDIFLRNNYIETDDGVIFESKHVENIISFDSSKEFDFKTKNPDFLMIYFKVKQMDFFYNREYRKVQDLLAQIGGFINCFWIIAFLLNYLYSNLFMISHIITDVFTVTIPREVQNKAFIPLKTEKLNNLENKNKSENLQLKTQNIEINPEKHNEIELITKNQPILNPTTEHPLKKESSPFEIRDSPLLGNEINLKEIRCSSIEDLTIEKNEFNFSYSTRKIAEIEKIQKINQDLKTLEVIEDLKLGLMDYMHYYTGFFGSPERERKKLIIDKGSKILKTCLDIKFIIQKFYEIEKLKQILLEEKDLIKFDKLPKPELKISQEKNKNKREHSIISTVLNKEIYIEQGIKKSGFYSNKKI